MKFGLDGDQGSFYHWYPLRMDLFLFQTLVCMRISWGACSKCRYSGIIPGGSGVRSRICVMNKQHSLSDALILRNMFDLPASYKDAIFLLASVSGKNHGFPASVVFCLRSWSAPDGCALIVFASDHFFPTVTLVMVAAEGNLNKLIKPGALYLYIK